MSNTTTVMDAPAIEWPARALFSGPMELRDATQEGTLGTLAGYMAVFNEWTEIDSALEGHFLERVARGAFSKTFAERRDRIRCIFHHGNDASVGVRVLGPVAVLEERDDGAYAEVPLLDTSYNRDLAPGIRAGLYGMSFRFKAVRQNMDRSPRRSSHNPNGIPERTLTELMVPEFGPTPFQAYDGAQAGMRSITDDIATEALAARGRIVLPAGYAGNGSGGERAAPEPAAADSENDDVQCTYCDAMNADDAVYCDQCGRKLEEPGGQPYQAAPDETVECPDCGCMNEDDALFCDQCGANLEEAENATSTRRSVAMPAGTTTRVVTGRLYERAVRFAATRPWAMEPQALAVVLAILQERAAGHWPTATELRQRLGLKPEAATFEYEDDPVEPEPAEEDAADPVALISISGPIVPHAGMIDATSSELVSVDRIGAQFRAALADPAVKHIVFNYDSPGGQVSLVPELAAEILAARGQKPMTAVANTMMASAAYWLGAMCDEVVASPSADVGSVGVYSAHQDLTKYLDSEGVKITMVTSDGSPYKAEFSPFVELSDDAKAEMQRVTDAIMGDFVGALAEARGTTTKDVLANFGQGRCLLAPEALAAGMVDRIGTLDSVLQELRSSGATAPASGGAEEDDKEEAAVAAAAIVAPHPAPARRGLDPNTLLPKEEPGWRL